MPGYRQLRDDGGHSPPQRPYHQHQHQPSDDLNSNELHPLNYPAPARSPSPTLYPQESADSYSTRYDPHAHDSQPDGDLESKPLKGDFGRELELKTYKRRYFGLAELVLLNFAIGWGNAAPGVVATTATEWFDISYPMLNSLSIAANLVFLLPAPFVIWVLNRHGPKRSILIAAILTVVGNWIIYGGTRAKSFPVNVAGTIVSALASPFVISAPTRYSRQWFSDRSRTFATAAQSLAHPLGAGFGALTGPLMVKPVGPFDYAEQALIIAIVFTAVSLPVAFIPKEPPTPPSLIAAAKRSGIRDGLKSLVKNRPFYLLLFTHSIVDGSVNTLTATTTQAIVPYGFTQTTAGFALALLVFVGIFTAIAASIILDRTKKHVLALKILISILAVLITCLPFVIETQSMPALLTLFALIGVVVFPMPPAILETQSNWTHPVSPEFSSFLCASGAKIIGALFTYVAASALVLDEAKDGHPKGSIFYGEAFIAAMNWTAVPALLLLGVWIFKRPAHSEV